MKRSFPVLSIALALGAAGSLSAQPTLTSLGGGSPLTVTNVIGGTYYIGGSGLSSPAADRWTLTGATLTASEIAGSSGGGYLSTDDGAYIATHRQNGTTLANRFVIGNLTPANAVSPPFNAPTYDVPASLAPSATNPGFTELLGTRWSFAGGSFLNTGALPIIPFTPSDGPRVITTIACAAGLATVTTSTDHGLIIGDTVVISGNSTTSYNGIRMVTGVPSTTTFEFAVTCAANGTGGTVVKQVLGNTGVFGSSSSGGSTGSFLSAHRISANGRFMVGQAYACVYNGGATAGTSISDSSFLWRPVIWDAEGNGGAGSMTVLPTPFRTGSSAGARRRTGNAYAVSNDGLVVAGAQEHNVGVTPGPDVDGGRFVVWRYDTGTSTWGMTYLDTGVDGSGFPKYISSTPSALAMNAAGTIIAARGPDGITKWVWNGSSWGAPTVIGSNLGPTIAIAGTITCTADVVSVTTATPHGLSVGDNVNIAGVTHSGTLASGNQGFNGYYAVINVPSADSFEYSKPLCVLDTLNNPVTGSNGTVNGAASWIPSAVRSCALPPNLGATLAMSEDGNTIAGSATYSTCGSFMTQGFIWHNADNVIEDWYDYNVAKFTPGCSTGGFWGPIGDLADPSKGQPVLGNPIGISPDGSVVVGRQGGNQIIAGAPPWIWQETGGPACVPASIVNNPAAVTNFTACSSSIILNVTASGTPPLTYQWYKGATPLVNGPSGFGSDITGATSFQFRITPPAGQNLAAEEAGTYTCVVTGNCDSPVTTAAAVVQTDAAFPPALNDTCLTAVSVSEGTNVLSNPTGPSPCSAYASDPNFHSCATGKNDLWYVFTPQASSDYRIETCGANFNTVLSIYDGCAGSELACNDDFVAADGACASQASRIPSINLTENIPYYLKLSARSNAFVSGTSTFNLSINPVVRANDECANATIAVVSTSLASPGNSLDNSGAVPGLTTNCVAPGNITARDVWFQYTTPATPACGRIALTTCPGGGTWNTVLEVFDSCGGTVLACNDNLSTTGPNSPAGCTASSHAGIRMLPTTANTTYYVRVGGNSSTAYGAGKLHVFVLGDTDGDGARTSSDVASFATAVLSASYNVFADMDGNGTVNGLDIQQFVTCLVP